MAEPAAKQARTDSEPAGSAQSRVIYLCSIDDETPMDGPRGPAASGRISHTPSASNAAPAQSRVQAVDRNKFGKLHFMLHTSIHMVRKVQAGKTKEIRIAQRGDVVGDFLAAMAERKTMTAIWRPLKAHYY